MRVGFKRERDCSSSQAYMQWQIFSVEILGGKLERESQCFWARKTRRKYHHMKQDRVGHCTIMLITFFCDFSNIQCRKSGQIVSTENYNCREGKFGEWQSFLLLCEINCQQKTECNPSFWMTKFSLDFSGTSGIFMPQWLPSLYARAQPWLFNNQTTLCAMISCWKTIRTFGSLLEFHRSVLRWL